MVTYTAEKRYALAIERGILVDIEDAWLLHMYSWTINVGGYACTRIPFDDGYYVTTLLHHCIMGMPIWENEEIDHIDRNRLNNCRSNLRYVTHQENTLNNNRRAGVTGMKGVTRTYNDKYVAQTKRGGIYYYIGCYDTIEEAAMAYSLWHSLNQPQSGN